MTVDTVLDLSSVRDAPFHLYDHTSLQPRGTRACGTAEQVASLPVTHQAAHGSSSLSMLMKSALHSSCHQDVLNTAQFKSALWTLSWFITWLAYAALQTYTAIAVTLLFKELWGMQFCKKARLNPVGYKYVWSPAKVVSCFLCATNESQRFPEPFVERSYFLPTL